MRQHYNCTGKMQKNFTVCPPYNQKKKGTLHRPFNTVLPSFSLCFLFFVSFLATFRNKQKQNKHVRTNRGFGQS